MKYQVIRPMANESGGLKKLGFALAFLSLFALDNSWLKNSANNIGSFVKTNYKNITYNSKMRNILRENPGRYIAHIMEEYSTNIPNSEHLALNSMGEEIFERNLELFIRESNREIKEPENKDYYENTLKKFSNNVVIREYATNVYGGQKEVVKKIKWGIIPRREKVTNIIGGDIKITSRRKWTTRQPEIQPEGHLFINAGARELIFFKRMNDNDSKHIIANDIIASNSRGKYLMRKLLVAVGSSTNQTPQGYGVIVDIRPPTFRYTEGKNAGRIKRTYLHGDMTVKIPYDIMWALEPDMNRGDRDYVIHSTVNPHSMGWAVTKGCVRVKMGDMLSLKHIVERGTQVHSYYDTIKVNKRRGTVHIYGDEYGKGANNLDNLIVRFEERGVDYSNFDAKKLEMTCSRPKIRYDVLLKSLSQGSRALIYVENKEYAETHRDLHAWWITDKYIVRMQDGGDTNLSKTF